jgi:hypothetical protein
LTITVKLQLASGATPLEAVQLTIVDPTSNVCGDVITVAPTLHVIVGDGMPVAVTVNETDAEHTPGAASAVIVPGHVIVGGTPIWIVTSANESGHGGFEIVHLSLTCPIPVA